MTAVLLALEASLSLAMSATHLAPVGVGDRLAAQRKQLVSPRQVLVGHGSHDLRLTSVIPGTRLELLNA